MRRFRGAALDSVCLLITWILLLRHVPQMRYSPDVRRYRQIADTTAAFLRGEADAITSEYPPLATCVFLLARSISGDLSFAVAWAAFVMLSVVGACVFARLMLRRGDAALIAAAALLTSLMLGSEVVFARYDLLVGLLLLCTWRCHVQGFMATAGGLFALACCLKLVPVLAAPLLFIAAGRGRRRFAAAFAVTVVAATLLPTVVLTPSGVMSVLSSMRAHHAGRGVQVESIWSGVHMLFTFINGGRDPIRIAAMAYDNAALGRGTVMVSTSLVLLSVAGVWVVGRLKQRCGGGDVGPLLFVLLLLAIGLSPVLSPQYLVWVVPMLVVHVIERVVQGGRRDVSAFGMLAITVMMTGGTQWIFPAHYEAFLAQESLAPILVHNVRNASILLLAGALLWEVLRGPASALDQPAEHV